MSNIPILMEDHFTPGFKNNPSVHVGSQTLKLFDGIPEEQAWEGVTLAGAHNNDLAVVRNISPEYISYWKRLMDNPNILNILDSDGGSFLTQTILDNNEYKKWIKDNMTKGSNLKVFYPTALEDTLSKELGAPLHGTPRISNMYGVKSGIRRLAKEYGIKMAEGFICTNYREAQEAIDYLKGKYECIAVKHDLSVSGYYSKKLKTENLKNIKNHIRNLTGKPLAIGKDVFVIEGWIKSKASLCAQIEIVEGKEPFVCAGWQQIIDADGISYLGGGPLILSPKALKSFLSEVKKLAKALKDKGAIGSFGPDFLVAADDEINCDPDSCVLLELNARVPYTAFPLEIIKQIKGVVGSGFYTKHIKVKKRTAFRDIEEALKNEKLLIQKKDRDAKGVVPYNTGLLPWNIFDVAIMADDWEETLAIASKVNKLFN